MKAKKYCEYYIKNFGKIRDEMWDFDKGNQTEMANILYYFLKTLTDNETKNLNEWIYEFFGRSKTKNTIENKMHGFVKHLRQGDTFGGEHSGCKDMILYHILNDTDFFEDVIFEVNNNSF